MGRIARGGGGRGRPRPGRLLLVFAHPDDEAFFTAGTVARHVAAGGEAMLVCGTKGERGSQPRVPVCPQSELGRVRAAELAEACRVMGAGRLEFLGYEDRLLGQADFEEASGKIVRVMEDWRPGAVVTFGPDGIYGHPDHVAIHRLTQAAFDRVFGPDTAEGPRLWYVATSSAFWRYRPTDWQAATRERPRRAGRASRRVPVTEGAPEAAIDIRPVLETKLRALLCHRSQRHNVERVFGSLYDLDRLVPREPQAVELLGREFFTLARGPRPRYVLEESLLESGL